MSDHLKIEWGDEPARPAQPLELMPKQDDPVRPITKPCEHKFNWATLGVLAFDTAAWLGLIALISWAWPDIISYLEQFK